jgi:3-oxoacyl-[acyl-carrier-protein] synthase-3
VLALRTPRARAGSTLLSLGEYRPRAVVSNASLAARSGGDPVTDRWIRDRVGIVERRFAAPDESVVEMATLAASKALAAAGLPAAHLDVVVLASCSMPTPMPNGAAQIAARLGVTAAAFDVNAACAGFCCALGVADGLVRTGTARYVLVVGAERMRDWVDIDDPRTSVVFADGAAAAVVGPATAPGIGPVVWGSDGGLADLIGIPADTGRISMDGPRLFRWAITELAPVARRACAAAGVSPAQLAAFVPHQANLRIIDALARDLEAPQAIVARDLVHAGNTSAASIPLALTGLVHRRELAPGSPLLLLGFGAGLTYAAQVVHSP